MVRSLLVKVSLDAQWAELEDEWRGIMSREQSRQPADLSGWEADMERLAAEQALMMREGRWTSGPDDLLSIIQRERCEAYHSAILAWLLDPQGRHGLGTKLLEALLRQCGGDVPDDLYGARLQLEIQRGETRADILVSGPGLFLVIENKVDAGEQDRQCDRLFERFGEDPAARFIFLTPAGRAPQTATGLARKAFIPLSYPEIARLLRDVYARGAGSGASLHGREVVSNYLSTLDKEFR